MFFFAAVYSQVSLGYSASNAGLYLLVFFAGFAPAAQIGGRMLDLRGAKRPMVLGCALSAVGFVLWARDINHLSLGSQWIYIVDGRRGNRPAARTGKHRCGQPGSSAPPTAR